MKESETDLAWDRRSMSIRLRSSILKLQGLVGASKAYSSWSLDIGIRKRRIGCSASAPNTAIALEQLNPDSQTKQQRLHCLHEPPRTVKAPRTFGQVGLPACQSLPDYLRRRLRKLKVKIRRCSLTYDQDALRFICTLENIVSSQES